MIYYCKPKDNKSFQLYYLNKGFIWISGSNDVFYNKSKDYYICVDTDEKIIYLESISIIERYNITEFINILDKLKRIL